MKKLTNAQEKVLKGIRDDVVRAKSNTLYRWLGEVAGLDWWNVGEKHPRISVEERESLAAHQRRQLDVLLQRPDCRAFWTECYDRIREAQEVVCHAPSGTLRALERLGLVIIVRDSADSRGYGLDRVRLTEPVPVTSER